jgi:DNA repair protein RadC
MSQRGDALSSPDVVRDYLRLSIASRPVEVFVGLFLDSQHRLVAAEELFQARWRRPASIRARL